MANTNVSHGEVKSICDKLECSPQSNFNDSPYGGKPELVTHRAGEGQAQSKGTSKTFAVKSSGGRSSTPAGYKGKFAQKAKKA